MAHDIVIRNGQLVDGSGAEPYFGDLAIDKDRISALGEISERGRREIDAEGHMVTPGFVDLHTHLDAQIGWDPDLTPVSWHGVTTALMGNCGVTFAPCKPADKELLAGMMETVEDIPREAILSGLPWNWEGYGGYLDAIDGTNPGINIAGLVGHCAVRFYVMGERAVEEQATPEEKQRMAEIVGQSIDDGAYGFSTNRFVQHVLPDGRSIPGTFAEKGELIEIAKVVAPRRALMQNVLNFEEREFSTELLRDLARTTGSRVLFSFGVSHNPTSGLRAREYVDSLCEGGLDISAISQPRASGFVFGLQSMLPVKGTTWKSLRNKNLSERLAAINDTETSRKLVAEGRAADAALIPVEQVYWMGSDDTPDYTTPSDDHLGNLAQAAGEHWCETFLRLSRETEGKGLFTFRMFNRSMEALEEFFRSERAFPSLGDAGAHVSQIMDAGWATFVLSHWVRERGLYSMGEGVRRLTSAPARIIGLSDRGLLAPGMKADVNVFDADQVAELQPELVHDFPGGAPRFIQRSKGYKATLVNGQVNVENGEHVGVRAGGVLRHGH